MSRAAHRGWWLAMNSMFQQLLLNCQEHNESSSCDVSSISWFNCDVHLSWIESVGRRRRSAPFPQQSSCFEIHRRCYFPLGFRQSDNVALWTQRGPPAAIQSRGLKPIWSSCRSQKQFKHDYPPRRCAVSSIKTPNLPTFSKRIGRYRTTMCTAPPYNRDPPPASLKPRLSTT